MIGRRGFLAGMLALGAAPAIVTSKGFRPLFQPEGRFFDHVGWDFGEGGKTAFIRGEVGRWEGLRIVETLPADSNGFVSHRTLAQLREKARRLDRAPRTPDGGYAILVSPDYSDDIIRVLGARR